MCLFIEIKFGMDRIFTFETNFMGWFGNNKIFLREEITLTIIILSLKGFHWDFIIMMYK
jgi:hypothetical protein